VITFEDLARAAEAFQKAFGKEVAELEVGAVARAIREEVGRREEAIREVHTLLLTHRLPGAELLGEALAQLRGLMRGTEDGTVLAFNGCHAEIKEADRRANELAQALTDPRLHDLQRARGVLQRCWPFLEKEPDVSEGLREQAAKLDDLLKQETFFRQLPDIDQHARSLETAYGQRFQAAVTERAAAYTKALTELKGTPGWEEAAPAEQEHIAAPLASRIATEVEATIPIPQLRADTEACSARLQKAVAELATLLAGNRLVRLSVSGYFAGGIENEEQLDAALAGLRQECLKLLGMGKKILIQ
jgi:hypothetical protein